MQHLKQWVLSFFFFGKEGGIIVFGMDPVHSLFSVLLLVNYLMDFDQLEHIIIWDSKRDDKILVTLTYFSRSPVSFKSTNKPCLHSIF